MARARARSQAEARAAKEARQHLAAAKMQAAHRGAVTRAKVAEELDLLEQAEEADAM